VVGDTAIVLQAVAVLDESGLLSAPKAPTIIALGASAFGDVLKVSNRGAKRTLPYGRLAKDRTLKIIEADSAISRAGVYTAMLVALVLRQRRALGDHLW